LEHPGVVKTSLYQIKKAGKGKNSEGSKKYYCYKKAEENFLGNVHYLPWTKFTSN
jgi:hypothetical protein